MPATRQLPAPRTASTRATLRQYLPRQHGVWAMLTVPLVLGAAAGGWSWRQLLLATTAVTLYLLLAAASRWTVSRFRARYRRPVVVLGCIAAPQVLATVILTPRLAWFTLVLVPVLAVNLMYAWRRRERSALNDLASVVGACALAPAAALAGAGGLGADEVWRVVGLTAAAALYLVGTVLYVKTMIRERDNRAYLNASAAYHGVAAVAAALLAPWLGVLFVVLAVRAVVAPRLPGRPLRPGIVGSIEVVNSVALIAVALWAVPSTPWW